MLSTPDNQNKELVKIFLGPDPVTGDQLYDVHPRRAQLYTNVKSLEEFRSSEYATRQREAARAAGRVGGVIVGKRQLVDARCRCIKRRKPSECDCLHHTFAELNLHAWDVAREGWRSAAREKGASPCPDTCHIHGPARRAPMLAELAADEERRAWEAASAGAVEAAGADERAASAKLSSTRRREADAAATAAVERAAAYDNMSKSEHHLRAALLPCGKETFADMNVTGAPPFKMYPKACALGNCPNKLWRGRDACGWERRFGSGCPMDAGDQMITMQRWEQKLRGKKVDDEGVVKQSFSLELLPHTLTGRAFYKEMQTFVTNTYLSHDWRTTWTEQAHRVYEDKKSGAARDAVLGARDAAAAAAASAAERAAAAARKAALLSAVAPILSCFAVNFGPIGTAAVGEGATVTTYDYRQLPHTLTASPSPVPPPTPTPPKPPLALRGTASALQASPSRCKLHLLSVPRCRATMRLRSRRSARGPPRAPHARGTTYSSRWSVTSRTASGNPRRRGGSTSSMWTCSMPSTRRDSRRARDRSTWCRKTLTTG